VPIMQSGSNEVVSIESRISSAIQAGQLDVLRGIMDRENINHYLSKAETSHNSMQYHLTPLWKAIKYVQKDIIEFLFTFDNLKVDLLAVEDDKTASFSLMWFTVATYKNYLSNKKCQEIILILLNKFSLKDDAKNEIYALSDKGDFATLLKLFLEQDTSKNIDQTLYDILELLNKLGHQNFAEKLLDKFLRNNSSSLERYFNNNSESFYAFMIAADLSYKNGSHPFKVRRNFVGAGQNAITQFQKDEFRKKLKSYAEDSPLNYKCEFLEILGMSQYDDLPNDFSRLQLKMNYFAQANRILHQINIRMNRGFVLFYNAVDFYDLQLSKNALPEKLSFSNEYHFLNLLNKSKSQGDSSIAKELMKCISSLPIDKCLSLAALSANLLDPDQLAGDLQVEFLQGFNALYGMNRQRNLREAIKSFENVIAKLPSNQDLHFYHMLATAAWLVENSESDNALQKAVNSFKKLLTVAVDLNPLSMRDVMMTLNQLVDVVKNEADQNTLLSILMNYMVMQTKKKLEDDVSIIIAFSVLSNRASLIQKTDATKLVAMGLNASYVTATDVVKSKIIMHMQEMLREATDDQAKFEIYKALGICFKEQASMSQAEEMLELALSLHDKIKHQVPQSDLIQVYSVLGALCSGDKGCQYFIKAFNLGDKHSILLAAHKAEKDDKTVGLALDYYQTGLQAYLLASDYDKVLEILESVMRLVASQDLNEYAAKVSDILNEAYENLYRLTKNSAADKKIAHQFFEFAVVYKLPLKLMCIAQYFSFDDSLELEKNNFFPAVADGIDLALKPWSGMDYFTHTSYEYHSLYASAKLVILSLWEPRVKDKMDSVNKAKLFLNAQSKSGNAPFNTLAKWYISVINTLQKYDHPVTDVDAFLVKYAQRDSSNPDQAKYKDVFHSVCKGVHKLSEHPGEDWLNKKLCDKDTLQFMFELNNHLSEKAILKSTASAAASSTPVTDDTSAMTPLPTSGIKIHLKSSIFKKSRDGGSVIKGKQKGCVHRI